MFYRYIFLMILIHVDSEIIFGDIFTTGFLYDNVSNDFGNFTDNNRVKLRENVGKWSND